VWHVRNVRLLLKLCRNRFPPRVLSWAWVSAMLSDLGKDEKEALARAAECRRKAESTRHEDVRNDYLDMEQRWLRLAESYAAAARIQSFIRDRKRR
jgi:hypothetical protein